ncbi:MAG: AraC family transcriptional regulator [Anaerolineae bacterium]
MHEPDCELKGSQITCYPLVEQHTPSAAYHAHDYHELVFLREGSGYHETLDARYPMGHGDIFYFAARQPHRANTQPRAYYRMSVLSFPDTAFSIFHEDERMVRRFMQALEDRAHHRANMICITDEGFAQAEAILEDMEREDQEKWVGYQVAIRAKAMQLLLTMMRDPLLCELAQRCLRPSMPSDRLWQVFRFVEQNYMHDIRLEDAVAASGLSRSRFYHVFKQETGVTFVDYINTLRLRRAKELLLTSHLPIVDVALESGFDSLSHFYGLFKRMEGVSPKTFRQCQRERINEPCPDAPAVSLAPDPLQDQGHGCQRHQHRQHDGQHIARP